MFDAVGIAVCVEAVALSDKPGVTAMRCSSLTQAAARLTTAMP